MGWFSARLILVGLMLGATACGHRHGSPCLSGTLVERFEDREDLQLLRREYERAQAAEPLVRARIYESLPRLFPDLSNYSDEPLCSREFVEDIDKELRRRPLTFNNATLHYLSALGKVRDTSPIMDLKADILLSLATIPEGKVSPYRRFSNERGPSPLPSHLRGQALVELVRSNLYLNDARVRTFLLEKTRTTTSSSEELLLLHQTSRGIRQGDPLAKDIVDRWFVDIPATLKTSAKASAFELLLERLRVVAQVRDKTSATKPLLEDIILQDGQLPITAGKPDWERDLAIVTRLSLGQLQDIESGQSGGWSEQIPYPSRTSPDLPDEAPENRFTWDEEVLLARLKELDDELARVSDPALACWLYEQRGYWTPKEEKRAWFGAFLSSETVPACQFQRALESEAIPLAQRLATISSVLGSTREAGSNSAASVRLRARLGNVSAARRVLRNHLSWLKHRDLRHLVLEETLEMWSPLVHVGSNTLDSVSAGIVRFEYQRVLHDAVALESTDGGRGRALAQQVVEQWIGWLMDLSEPTFSTHSAAQLFTALLLSSAEFAPGLELEEQMRSLLQTRASGDDPYFSSSWSQRHLEMARWIFLRSGGSLDP